MSRSIITKLHKKITFRAIFKKIRNLRNFRFYNFSQNLGFRSLEKGLTILQLLRILHGKIIISKFLRKTSASIVFWKICVLRNFTFQNFSENLCFHSLEEGWGTFQLLLISCSIAISKLHKKLASRSIFKKPFTLRNFAFQNFYQNLGFQRLQEDWATLQQFIIPSYHCFDKALSGRDRVSFFHILNNNNIFPKISFKNFFYSISYQLMLILIKKQLSANIQYKIRLFKVKIFI